MFRLLALLTWLAADWLSSSADPQHTRSQPAETELSPVSVSNLKLLWSYRFEEQVTAPIVLGPIVTHRGIKELVFVAGAQDHLYAVDADLGRLVWKREFQSASGFTTCATPPKLTAAPVLAPYNGPAPEGDDASTPRRSLFVLTSSGFLATVRPADGKDLALPEKFTDPGIVAGDLSLESNKISSFVTAGCAFTQTGVWTHELHSDSSTLGLQAAPDAAVATWKGVRIGVTGSKLLARRDSNLIWSVDGLDRPQPPVIANGVVFTVAGTALAAFDFLTGKELFRSEPNGTAPAQNSLAIANGHVYFVAATVLYCYGFPMEI